MKYELKVFLNNGESLTIRPKICEPFSFTFSCCGQTAEVRDGHEEEDCYALAAHRCKEAA